MKTQIKKAALLLATLGVVLASCNDDDNNQVVPKEKTGIENLETVVFTETPPKTLSSEKTGNVVPDPTTGTDKYEYLTTVEKSYAVQPLLIATQANNDVLFPGSILRGDSFMKGKYDPLVLANDFDSITLSITLKGDIKVAKTAKPILSEVRQAINILVAKQKDKIDYNFVPTVYKYDSNSISTEESFKRILKIHADAKILGGIVKANFDYSKEKANSQNKKYVMVAFRQSLYNASIDPKHYSKWIKGELNTKDMGKHEPVYVSSVDYGRIGYILVETNKSTKKVKEMIEASLKVAVKHVDFNANAEYVKEFKSLFSQHKVKVMINGGPVELGGKVDSYESFKKFVQMPNAENLVKTSVPVSYKIRRLKDNTEVEVYDTYTESFIEKKDN